MKNPLALGFISVALFAATVAFGATDSKEVTLSGTGKCAKCSLGIADKCQTAVVVKGADGKDETYLVANNKVAKAFHKNICEEDKPVTVTGKVKEVDGKKEITASKIEVSKS